MHQIRRDRDARGLLLFIVYPHAETTLCFLSMFFPINKHPFKLTTLNRILFPVMFES